jgi:hypothetical protein
VAVSGRWSSFAAQVEALPPDEFVWAYLFALAVAGSGLFYGFRQLVRARLMLDTPTSRIASAAQGFVELEGRADLLPGPVIRCPLTGTRCVWWEYRVERKLRDSRNRSRWRTVVHAVSDELFLLRDGSGECIVDPHGAVVRPGLSRRWQGLGQRPARVPEKTPWISFGPYRYTERLLRIGDPLYTLGHFRTQHGAASFDEQADLRELLAEWKRDQAELLRRFDANQDGVIDLTEWETVRRAALEAVRQKHIEQAVHPDLNVLSRPPDRRPYLLSALPQSVLIRRKRWRSAAGIVLGSGGFLVLLALLEFRGLL